MERHKWAEAAGIVSPVAAPAHVVAMAIWAQGLGLARSGHPADTHKRRDDLEQIEEPLQRSGDIYWATQVRVMKDEVMAWTAKAEGKGDDAILLLRKATDEEDSMEKLPVTPGPIVPAREQLGEMLLEQGQPKLAAKEFRTVIAASPGRRGALNGSAEADEPSRQR